MSDIQWSDRPAHTTHTPTHTSHPHHKSEAGDPWFPIALGAIGLIVGYLLGSVL